METARDRLRAREKDVRVWLIVVTNLKHPAPYPGLEAAEMIVEFLGVAPTTADLATDAPTGVMLDGIGTTDAEANRTRFLWDRHAAILA